MANMLAPHLGSLPKDVLHLIMRQAAFPLSLWVAVDEAEAREQQEGAARHAGAENSAPSFFTFTVPPAPPLRLPPPTLPVELPAPASLPAPPQASSVAAAIAEAATAGAPAPASASASSKAPCTPDTVGQVEQALAGLSFSGHTG